MKKRCWWWLSLLIVVLDQGSKHLAMFYLLPYHPYVIWPSFNLTLAYNTGAAFSFLSNAGAWHRWFFTSFSLLMCIGLSIWLKQTPTKAMRQGVALSLILGGAVGNLLDRLFLGHVIDFIDVYYKNYHWPIFNLADSAICVGAGLLLLDVFIKPSK